MQFKKTATIVLAATMIVHHLVSIQYQHLKQQKLHSQISE